VNDAQGHDAGGSRPARPRYTFLWGSLAVLGVSLCVLRVAAASQSGDPAAAEAARTLWQTVGIWVAALMTLGIFSFLFKDNPLYKICESVLIGVSAAYWMVYAFWSTLAPQLFAKLSPTLVKEYVMPSLTLSETPTQDFLLSLVPLVLGAMLLWRLAPKGQWISGWPIAMIIGVTAGLRITSALESDFLAQIAATMKPLVVFQTSVDAAGVETTSFAIRESLAGVVGVVGVLSVLTYFLFSVEHKGAVGKTARLGIWFLMITFGGAFGLTVMGRITLLAQRFEFLFREWLGIA
jgi:hypothetical protein